MADRALETTQPAGRIEEEALTLGRDRRALQRFDQRLEGMGQIGFGNRLRRVDRGRRSHRPLTHLSFGIESFAPHTKGNMGPCREMRHSV